MKSPKKLSKSVRNLIDAIDAALKGKNKIDAADRDRLATLRDGMKTSLETFEKTKPK